MATLPAYNPLSPHLALIPGGLRHGLMIRIKGQMNHGGNRFNIFIQTGAALRPRSDVNIHLSVRPLEHCILRNHLENQVWGTEERYGGCPIQPGQHFDILVLAEATAYKIAVNNVHYCHFNHRIPLNRVQFISVDGDVKINSIILEGDIQSVPTAPYPTAVSPRFPAGGVQVLPVMPMPTPPQPPPPPYTPYPSYPTYRSPGPHNQATFTPYTLQAYPSYPHNYNASNRADNIGFNANTSTYGTYSPMQQQIQHEKELKKKKKKKALKYAAAGIGGVGLGAFALSRALGGGGEDDDGDDYGGDD